MFIEESLNELDLFLLETNNSFQESYLLNLHIQYLKDHNLLLSEDSIVLSFFSNFIQWFIEFIKDLITRIQFLILKGLNIFKKNYESIRAKSLIKSAISKNDFSTFFVKVYKDLNRSKHFASLFDEVKEMCELNLLNAFDQDTNSYSNKNNFLKTLSNEINNRDKNEFRYSLINSYFTPFHPRYQFEPENSGLSLALRKYFEKAYFDDKNEYIEINKKYWRTFRGNIFEIYNRCSDYIDYYIKNEARMLSKYRDDLINEITKKDSNGNIIIAPKIIAINSDITTDTNKIERYVQKVVTEFLMITTCTSNAALYIAINTVKMILNIFRIINGDKPKPPSPTNLSLYGKYEAD